LFRKPASKELAANRLANKHQLEAYVASLADARGCVSPDAIEKYLIYQAQLDLEPRDAFDCLGVLKLGLANGSTFIRTSTTLVLEEDEAAVYDTGAALMTEVKDREYRASAQGMSVPLGHGLPYQAAANRGRLVTVRNHREPADQGRLTVTTQQIIYHGKRKILAFPFATLSMLETYSDGIGLGATSHQATATFRLTNPHVVAGIVFAAHKGQRLVISETVLTKARDHRHPSRTPSLNPQASRTKKSSASTRRTGL
jgi:hypothetical protein